MNRASRLMIGIAGVLAVYLLLSLLYPVSMYYDSGNGFFVWRSMLHGAPFNCYTVPDALDQALDRQVFQAWWSPGQYLIPGLISLTGLSIGKAIWVTVALFSISGLAGCYLLYRDLGFSRDLTLATLLILVLTRGFTLPFHTYNGGEILLFGLLPWVIIVALRLRQRPVLSTPILIAGFLAAVFLKLSFVVTALAILAAIVWINHREGASLRRLAAISVGCGTTFIIFYGLLNRLFLSHGANPGDYYGKGYSLFPVIYPISAPLMSALSFGEVLPRIFVSNDAPILDSLARLDWLYLIFAVASLLVYRELHRTGPRLFRELMLPMLVVYSVVMTLLIFWNPIVSFEDRHFRPVGLVLAPGVTALIWQHRSRLLRGLLFLTLAVGIGYSLVSYGAITRRNCRAPVGRAGVIYYRVTKETLDSLHAQDDAWRPGDPPIIIPRYDLSLELLRARVLVREETKP